MMLQGGNSQLREYFDKLKIENAPIEKLYQLRASAHYREKLRERVCFLALDNGLSGESPNTVLKKKSSHRNSFGNESPSSRLPSRLVNAIFSEGPLGMTLCESADGNTYVSQVTAGGSADKNEVKVGDLVVKVAGRQVSNYEEVMDSIPFIQRPMRLEFLRIIEQQQASKKASIPRELSWQPLFSLQNDNISQLKNGPQQLDQCELNSVNKDSIACVTLPSDLSNESYRALSILDLSVPESAEKSSASRQVQATKGETDTFNIDDSPPEDWILDASSSYSLKGLLTFVFESSPLGITLSMNSYGAAEVTKVLPEGNAEVKGVAIGDIVAEVNGVVIKHYADVMKAIKNAEYPLILIIQRNSFFSKTIEDSLTTSHN